MVGIVTNARLLIGIVLGSFILSSMIASQQLGIAFVDSEPDEDEQSESIGPLILVVYLLFVIRYFVANEGRRYTVSAFRLLLFLQLSPAAYTKSSRRLMVE